MKFLNLGGRPPALDDARLTAANDLVQRTLAQHGLASGPEQTGAAGQSMATALQAYLTGQSGRSSKASVVLPEGAEFSEHTFSHETGSRRVRTYIPASARTGASGIVVMLHGCSQSPEDFATGTGMNALAETHGFVVIYPAQSRGDNAQSCWNWFSRGDQRRGRGEPAILAELARQAGYAHGVSREATFVAGLSAGAAMAVILGETYPDVFAAIGAHSGLPTGAATDVASAFAAMAGKAPISAGRGATGGAVRTIVFHGSSDTTVHPSNGEAIMRQTMTDGAHQGVVSSETGQIAGRAFSRLVSGDPGGPATAEHWVIDGLGHAWSGGQPGGSFTDPTGPDASAEMIRFFFEKQAVGA